MKYCLLLAIHLFSLCLLLSCGTESTPTEQITIDNETGVIDVTNPITGRTWMDRNLGASRAAQSSTDSQAYGDLYQWGRAADGHQKRNSGTTTILSNSDHPDHGDFILAPDSPFDWRSPQNNNFWQGMNGLNNPCPNGYRLPTLAEWEAERESWGSSDAGGAFASQLKLPAAGLRIFRDGSFNNVGASGSYKSSTIDNNRAQGMFFRSDAAGRSVGPRANGHSVRCIKN